ncbi:MAG: pyridoxal phosphate-dependent aminotransferase [Bacteroidia bacterium]|nr:pyridoxal phosphate-dependent aminotransferase [Bacteroidia bacterium]MDW8089166.1 pyridoxal phosphate-dependent aminotransferase [Bacteroidia bacterium]
MTGVAQRVAELSEAQTLGMAQRVRELRAAGKPILSLLLGEPDFPVPEPIRAAAIAAIQEGHAPYPPVPGIAPLREAIASYYHRTYGVPCSVEWVVVSNGSKQAIFNALFSLIEPGEEVIVPAPYWVSYLPLVHLAQGKPIIVPTTQAEGYKLTPEKLARYLSPRTKALILCSPSNPTGSCYTRPELEALAEVLSAYPQVWVISDEIYELIRYEGQHVSPAQIPSLAERTVICNGFSKAFAMPGWRLGYALAPPKLAAAMAKVQGQTSSGANLIAQKAALAGLQSDLTQLLAPMLQAFRERRDYIYTYLKAYLPQTEPYLPEGAFYFLLNVSSFLGKVTPTGEIIADADVLTEYLLIHGVALVSGTAFGAPQHLRLSYAVSLNEIKAGLPRMVEALRALV